MTFLSKAKNRPLVVVVWAAIAFFAVCLVLTLHRYYSFYASYDQGIFNQLFWNGTHGRMFESSLSSALSTNVVHNDQVPEVFYYRLGQHFTPALMLWLPIYALFPSPVTLTVLQVTLVAAAGLVLYALARHYLEPRLSVAIALSFYCANTVIGPTLGNFHDICQIPLYVFSLLLAMEKHNWPLFAIFSVLILAVREDAGIVLFGIGFYMILSRRYPRTGLAVCVLSFGYIVLLTNLIMPLFSADISQRFMMERFGQYAEGEEASTLEILWGMVSNPFRLLGELFTPFGGTVKYLLGQWLPLAFVPAIAPASWIIAGFPLLKLFLGKGESVLAINIRYAMTVVPGLFYGAILWWANRQEQGRGETGRGGAGEQGRGGDWERGRGGAGEQGRGGEGEQGRGGEGEQGRGGAGGAGERGRLGEGERGRLGEGEQGRFPSSFFLLPSSFFLLPSSFTFQRFWAFCLCLSLFFTFTSNPNQTFSFILPDSVHPWVYVPLTRQWQHVSQMRSLLAQIPPNASVAATNYIVPHLSSRREILRFPRLELRNDALEVVKMEYVIADLWQMQKYQAAFKRERGQLRAIAPLIDQLSASGEYGIIDFRDGVILMQKGGVSEPNSVAGWKAFRQEISFF